MRDSSRRGDVAVIIQMHLQKKNHDFTEIYNKKKGRRESKRKNYSQEDCHVLLNLKLRTRNFFKKTNFITAVMAIVSYVVNGKLFHRISFIKGIIKWSKNSVILCQRRDIFIIIYIRHTNTELKCTWIKVLSINFKIRIVNKLIKMDSPSNLPVFLGHS